MEFGEVRYGTHKTDQPLVHKIQNKSKKQMLCIDVEVLKQPPISAAIPLVAPNHELIKTRDKIRVYKLTINPEESIEVTYPFFYISVVLIGGNLQSHLSSAAAGNLDLSWTSRLEKGDVYWKEPVTGLKQKNIGENTVVIYIAEWR